MPLNKTAEQALAAEYRANGVARFRIRKRVGRTWRSTRSTPWHLEDHVTGQQFLVSSWRGALELAEAVTR